SRARRQSGAYPLVRSLYSMMRRICAALVAALVASGAFAQQAGVPPIPLPARSIFGNPLPVTAFGSSIPMSGLFNVMFPTSPACSVHQWANGLTTNGLICSQPACSDLSNGSTGCSATIGTSGATVPLLNGNNVFSGDVSFVDGRPWCDVRGKGALGDGSTDDR